jgi:ketosteroid isomerase-like protein
MSNTRHFVISIILGSVASLNARAQVVDTTVTKREVLAADNDLARSVEASGAQTFLDALEPGAAVLMPFQPIMRGPVEARPAFVNRYELPSSYSWRATHVMVSTDGKLGCVVGLSRFVNASDTVKPMHRGHYITCWKRSSDGKWRIAAHQRNDSPGDDPRLADSEPLPGAPHSATVSIGSDQTKQLIQSESAFAAMGAEPAGPGPAFAKYIAPDGMLFFSPDRPRGPEKVKDAFNGFAPDLVLLWGPARPFLYATGGLGFSLGNAVTKPAIGKPGRARNGKFMTIWRQNADGTWSFIIDGGTPRP